MDTANPPPGYRDLLQAAWSLGRADGLFAATFEPDDAPAPSCPVCQGRPRGESADGLGGAQPGLPPSALTINAPLGYASGFAGGLADERRRTAARREDAFAWILLRTRALPRGNG